MKTCEPPGSLLPKKYITVCSRSRTWLNGKRIQPFPVICLSGSCLVTAGFKIGQVADIVCEPNQVIITLAKKQDFTAAKNLLKKKEATIV